MARPKEFDPDEALDRAVELFWEQGYEGTSVQQLVTRTGVHKRSMYEAFGDKHALFTKAVARYADEQDALLHAASISGEPATDVIRALLESAVVETTGGPPRGCLLVNSATEIAPRDPETARRVEQHFEACQRVLQQLVERGQQDGEIATRLDAATLGTLLLNAWLGLRVQARAGIPRPQLRAAAESALAVLA